MLIFSCQSLLGCTLYGMVAFNEFSHIWAITNLALMDCVGKYLDPKMTADSSVTQPMFNIQFAFLHPRLRLINRFNYLQLWYSVDRVIIIPLNDCPSSHPICHCCHSTCPDRHTLQMWAIHPRFYIIWSITNVTLTDSVGNFLKSQMTQIECESN